MKLKHIKKEPKAMSVHLEWPSILTCKGRIPRRGRAGEVSSGRTPVPRRYTCTQHQYHGGYRQGVPVITFSPEVVSGGLDIGNNRVLNGPGFQGIDPYHEILWVSWG